MSREEVFERLNEVFRDVFDEEDITVDEGTTAEDIDGWDSLEHINLMAAVPQAARSLMAREKQMPPSASLVFLACSLHYIMSLCIIPVSFFRRLSGSSPPTPG